MWSRRSQVKAEVPGVAPANVAGATLIGRRLVLRPLVAADFDHLIETLRDTLGLTVFMVTHDLDSLKTACNRIAVLGDRKVLLVGTMDDMLASQHPWLRAYFHGKRARAVVA